MERTHSWLNRFRRILVRWDKSPENYIAFLHFACAPITLRAAGLLGQALTPLNYPLCFDRVGDLRLLLPPTIRLLSMPSVLLAVCIREPLFPARFSAISNRLLPLRPPLPFL